MSQELKKWTEQQSRSNYKYTGFNARIKQIKQSTKPADELLSLLSRTTPTPCWPFLGFKVVNLSARVRQLAAQLLQLRFESEVQGRHTILDMSREHTKLHYIPRSCYEALCTALPPRVHCISRRCAVDFVCMIYILDTTAIVELLSY